jgi:hypothetical protein
MRRLATVLAGTVLMILALPTPASAAAATTAHPRDTYFAFVLLTPNTAVTQNGGMMAQPGDWIQVTGGGTFNPGTGGVHAGGGFVHHNADGTVHCEGTWKATALTGWTDFGASRRGLHGGTVSLVLTHYCATMGDIHTGIAMTVTSTRNAPSGSGYHDGVTIGEFTQPTGGTVAIHVAFPA